MHIDKTYKINNGRVRRRKKNMSLESRRKRRGKVNRRKRNWKSKWEEEND